MNRWERITIPPEPGNLFPRTTYFHIHGDETHHSTEWLSAESIDPVDNVKCRDCDEVMTQDDEILSPCQPARR